MNIQIFAKNKCFDSKKAERYFKERGLKYQRIDVHDKGLSKGELRSVIAAIGLDALIDDKSPDYILWSHLSDECKLDKLLETPSLYRTPIVRNGKAATAGYCPDTWKTWS